MSARRSQIYIASDLLHSLILLANAQSGDADMQRRVTAEDVAEEILRGHIKEHYPKLLKHKAEVDRLEKELIASLGHDTKGKI